jgi:hypothetical protein
MKFKGDIIITDPCYIIKDEPPGKPTFNDWPVLVGKGSKPFSDFTDEERAAYKQYREALDKWDDDHLDEWELCDCGENMEALGITHYLTDDTGVGDWNCVTIDKDTGQKIGCFCADAGLVGVFLLDEVLIYIILILTTTRIECGPLLL